VAVQQRKDLEAHTEALCGLQMALRVTGPQLQSIASSAAPWMQFPFVRTGTPQTKYKKIKPFFWSPELHESKQTRRKYGAVCARIEANPQENCGKFEQKSREYAGKPNKSAGKPDKSAWKLAKFAGLYPNRKDRRFHR